MAENTNTESTDDHLRVSIEGGPDFEPSPRVAAAIQELAAALDESAGADVEGFEAMTLNDEGPARMGEVGPRYSHRTADGLKWEGMRLEFDSRGNVH